MAITNFLLEEALFTILEYLVPDESVQPPRDKSGIVSLRDVILSYRSVKKIDMNQLCDLIFAFPI